MKKSSSKVSKKKYKKLDKSGKSCPENFSYNSINNKHFLKISELKKLIKSNLKFIKIDN